METPGTLWKTWQKIAFRFLFLFFAITSVLCLQLVVLLADLAFDKDGFEMDKMFKPLRSVVHWLDRYIFHIGYDPKLHGSFPGDSHFGVALYLTIMLFSILAAIVWSIADNKRRNYNKLYYWFCLYLRYVLAITLIGYGIDKVIPVQMPRPALTMLTEPYGNTNRFNILWGFMGLSPGYMIFTGTIELTAGLLLLFRRTTVAGCLLTIAFLTNVVALNWFYNIGVKMFSSQLLLSALFLVAPYLKTLFRFLFNQGSTPLYSPERYVFQTKWKKRLLTAILLFVTLAAIIPNAVADYKAYNRVAAHQRMQKAYDVTAFIAKDTLPPLTTDTVRWKRVLLFIYGDYFVVYNMQDKSKWFKFKADSAQKTFTLQNGPDKKKWEVLHYTNPAKNQLQLAGKWKGKNITVLLKLSPVDSIPLNKERLRFFEE
ncbi:MAG TPA: hypothetical protein VFE54_05310 [Mucilaginibacter sp.]|nr:hypothetical protein [Mucilaginibacter sp.]